MEYEKNMGIDPHRQEQGIGEPTAETEAEAEPVAATELDTKERSSSLWSMYRYLILVCIIFIGLSVYYAITFFPELSTGRAVFSGICFGVFCSMCAATYSQI